MAFLDTWMYLYVLILNIIEAGFWCYNLRGSCAYKAILTAINSRN